MKKGLLFYSSIYDSEIEKDIPELRKMLKYESFQLRTHIICDEPQMAEKYKIMHSPILILIVDGKETTRLIGTAQDMIDYFKKNELSRNKI